MAKRKTQAVNGSHALLDSLRDKSAAVSCSWLDRLTTDERALMEEVRKAWKAGEIPKGPMRVHEEIVGHLGDKAPSETTLRRFLGSKPARSV